MLSFAPAVGPIRALIYVAMRYRPFGLLFFAAIGTSDIAAQAAVADSFSGRGRTLQGTGRRTMKRLRGGMRLGIPT